MSLASFVRSGRTSRAPLPRLATVPPDLPSPPSLPIAEAVEIVDHKAGPHWGGFWPEEFIDDYDAVCFEPTSPKTPKRAEYAIYSDTGKLLGRVGERCKAITAVRHWKQASFVILDGRVCFRREDAPLAVGHVIGDEAEIVRAA